MAKKEKRPLLEYLSYKDVGVTECYYSEIYSDGDEI